MTGSLASGGSITSGEDHRRGSSNSLSTTINNGVTAKVFVKDATNHEKLTQLTKSPEINLAAPIAARKPFILPCGVSSQVGKRPNQEDTAFVSSARGRIPGNVRVGDSTGVYGVFDGHGGNRASSFCAAKVPLYFLDEQRSPVYGDKLAQAMKSMDEEFCSQSRTSARSIGRRRYVVDDGTTAVVATIHKKSVHVANIGDSRAILTRRRQRPIALSVDQKPSRPDEKQRLEELGATVTGLFCGRELPKFLSHYWPFNIVFDVPRVNGVLAMSRAIGDLGLKPFIVGEPELKVHELTADDEFLIMASDGVWDVLSNNTVSKIVTKEMNNSGDVSSAAQCVTKVALQRGTVDNVTVVVVDVRKVIEEADKNASETTTVYIDALNQPIPPEHVILKEVAAVSCTSAPLIAEVEGLQGLKEEDILVGALVEDKLLPVKNVDQVADPAAPSTLSPC